MHEGIWGHILGDNSSNIAKVVCRQFNKPGVKSLRMIEQETTNNKQLFWLNNVYCNGKEQRLLDCRRDKWLVSNVTFPLARVTIECQKGRQIHCYFDFILGPSFHLKCLWPSTILITKILHEVSNRVPKYFGIWIFVNVLERSYFHKCKLLWHDLRNRMFFLAVK